MKKGNIILIIVVLVILGAGTYLIVRFFSQDEVVIVPPSGPFPAPTPDGPDVIVTPPPPVESLIGKNVYAKNDGTSVYTNAFLLYKTAKKGEWVGKVYAVREDGYLKITADRLVYAGLVEPH